MKSREVDSVSCDLLIRYFAEPFNLPILTRTCQGGAEKMMGKGANPLQLPFGDPVESPTPHELGNKTSLTTLGCDETGIR